MDSKVSRKKWTKHVENYDDHETELRRCGLRDGIENMK